MGIHNRVVKPKLAMTIATPPFLIAEAGVNHEGNMDTARLLIEEAAEGGADAIKFQTYRSHTIASQNSPAYWDTEKEPTESQYKLFQKYDKFWKNEFEELRECCDVLGIEFLSTPFDKESAMFLNDLMDVFKISSSDITNRPFIEYICNFGKPVILSTGASNIDEIDRALEWIDAKGASVALLHCVLNYPTPAENANLRMITDLKRRYPDRVIGYSDHTLPGDSRVLELAYALGAEILEKHFTNDKNLPGNDHYHAMDRSDLIEIRHHLSRVETLLGQTEKHSLPSESRARRNARRSLVAACDISTGVTINDELLTWKRPAHGISPAEIKKVIGRRARQNIREDDLITWEMLE